MSPPNGPTLLRPPRMDYNRMNSFLEYPLCNRGPSAYSAHSAPTSFPPSSASAVDSYAGETRYGGGLPSSALQHNSGYLAQQPPSALGVPFPSSAASGYSSSHRAQIPSWRLHPQGLIFSQSPSPNTVTLEIISQHMNFGGMQTFSP